MGTFYKLLVVTLVAGVAGNFVWFALTYWAYLSTGSVVTTSTMGGVFLAMAAASGIWFGSIVDHSKKKTAMLGSSAATLVLFLLGYLLYTTTPQEAFSSVASVRLWLFIVILLAGALAGSIYSIAIPTLVAVIVPEDRRDRANGMFGTTVGIAFGITSVASGIALAFGGMDLVLLAGIGGTALAMALLWAVPVDEPEPRRSAKAGETARIDLRGTIRAVRAIPGLFPLIFFTTLNNLLGGVFFALMDAYGLSLVSVEVWGVLWGVLSLSFIVGGLYIARKGLGGEPLRLLFRNNVIVWTVCVFFAIQPSIVLLSVGIFIWMFFVPFTEAIEQTIFQNVVPPERLGRVFGFAHSVEQAASPVTAFLIGPIAQYAFIPFMTDGRGAEAIGSWFGTGPGRGIALVFVLAGVIGLLVTLFAMRSRSYRLLAARLREGRSKA